MSKRLGFLAVLVLLLSGLTFAQTSKGTIVGVVTDKSEAVIPNATVTATSKTGGEKRTTTTGPNGAYRLEALNPGVYEVSVQATGFAVTKVENLEVRASVQTTANAQLGVTGANEVVNVEATAGQELQTQTGELSGNISTVEIANLPIQGLNPIALVLTQPGVVAPSTREDFTNGVGFSVNGTRPRSNNFLIDGQDNNDISIAGQAFQPNNLEAYGEVTILTNSYGAEYGRGGGSVTNVIHKSGTNNWRGSLWEIHQNTALQAQKYEDKKAGIDKSSSRQNTFGFSFGGPVVREKLYGFGTAQWDRFRGSVNGPSVRVPTAAGFATLQSLGSNPNIAALLAAVGNLRGTENISTIALGNARPGIETGLTARQGVGQISNSIEWSTRWDWLPSQKDTFSFRYLLLDNTFTPDLFANPFAMNGYDTNQGGRSQNLGIQYTRVVSPSLVNEFRFSFGRINFSFDLTPETASNPLVNTPYITINGLTDFGYGVTTGFPQGRLSNNYQFQDAISWNKGNHSWKFGVDVLYQQQKQNIPFNSRGSIAIASGGGFTGLANYIDDQLGTGTISKQYGIPVVYPAFTNQAYYAQDSWKLRSNLTVNLGVRYERFGRPINNLPFPAIDLTTGLTDALTTRREVKADNNNWAPRVSFAYTPKFAEWLFGQEKTVVRGGYGMFYDTFFNNILVNTGASSPNVVGGTITSTGGRGQSGALQLISTITPGALNPLGTVTSVDRNLVNPITHQWNFGVQRELPGNFIATVAYVGTRGVRLFANDAINPGKDFDFTRINPARGAINVRTNSGDSIYHGMNADIERRFAKGLYIKGAYTFGRLIDTTSEVFATTGWSSYPQNPFDRAAERGLSAFHRKHRFVLTYVYDIPALQQTDNMFGKAVRYALKNWSISGSSSFQSGAPETVAVGYDSNGDLLSSDRPSIGNLTAPITSFAYDGDQVGGTSGVLYDGLEFDRNGVLKVVTANDVRWIVGSTGYGNVGRNTQIGEGRMDHTFGLARKIDLPWEGQSFTFRTEMFNPFNHGNAGNVSYNLQDTDFANKEITRFGGREIRFFVKYSF